jgi:hypothetical protein
MNDEIIEEVYAIRDAHASKFRYDLRAICEDLKKMEAEHIAAGQPFIAPLSEPMIVSEHPKVRFVK